MHRTAVMPENRRLRGAVLGIASKCFISNDPDQGSKLFRLIYHGPAARTLNRASMPLALRVGLIGCKLAG